MDPSVEYSALDASELRQLLAQKEMRWQRAERALSVQYAVSRILAGAVTFQEATAQVLPAICERLGWDFGALWQPDPTVNTLRCTHVWCRPTVEAEVFEQASREITLGLGVGLPGRVWASGEPATITDAPQDKNFPRAESASAAGLLGAFAFPIRADSEILGVLEFFSRDRQTLDKELLTLMAVLGSHIGQFLERTRGEEALRESEARYRLMIETSADAIFTIDASSTILVASRAAEKIFGYAPAELVGQSLTMLMPEYLRHLHQTALARYADTGHRHIPWDGVELSGLHRSGREIPLEITFGEHRQRGQHLFTGIVRDITERKNAEENRAWLAALVESSGAAIIGKSLDGIITSWNKGAEALYCYSAAEAIGQPISILIPPGHPDELGNILARIRQGETIDHFETTRMQKGGARVDVALTISPIKDAAGTIRGASTIARDVTGRRRHQEALEASEQRYRLLFESNPQPMWVYDQTTLEFLAVNQAAIYKYGYTSEEFLGMTLRHIRPSEDIPKLLDATSTPTKSLHTEGPWRHKRKDGSIIVVEITEHPLVFGGRSACLVMPNDITERIKLEEQFRQAQRLESVGRLAGGVAHDFNNLLTVINGYAEMLLTDLPTDEEARESLIEIRSAGERAAGLTQQLLAFSRRQIIEPVVLNINAIVTDMQKLLTRLIGEDLNLVTRLGPDLGHVIADAGQLQQIIMNLAINSRDAMPRGGTLLIETGNAMFDEAYTRDHAGVQPGPYVMLAVTDNGAGMTPEVREKAFEPFFTTKDLGKGTGLGLATVYGMVKQSGGWIWVYSEPGKGTTFKVYLPRTDKALSPAKPPSNINIRGNETILVVEDQTDLRTLAVVALGKYGYSVHGAGTGGEAMAFCQEFQGTIHLVLTDVVMPDMNGRELAGRVAGLRPDTRLLYMSGYTANVIAHHGVLDDGVAFLQKPFTPESLATKVREVLGPPITRL